MATRSNPASLAGYQDTGCAFAPACLSCPFDVCLEENGAGAHAGLLALRDRLIRRAAAVGYPTQELARRFELSAHQVYCIIRAGPGGRAHGHV